MNSKIRILSLLLFVLITIFNVAHTVISLILHLNRRLSSYLSYHLFNFSSLNSYEHVQFGFNIFVVSTLLYCIYRFFRSIVEGGTDNLKKSPFHRYTYIVFTPIVLTVYYITIIMKLLADKLSLGATFMICSVSYDILTRGYSSFTENLSQKKIEFVLVVLDIIVFRVLNLDALKTIKQSYEKFKLDNPSFNYFIAIIVATSLYIFGDRYSYFPNRTLLYLLSLQLVGFRTFMHDIYVVFTTDSFLYKNVTVPFLNISHRWMMDIVADPEKIDIVYNVKENIKQNVENIKQCYNDPSQIPYESITDNVISTTDRFNQRSKLFLSLFVSPWFMVLEIPEHHRRYIYEKLYSLGLTEKLEPIPEKVQGYIWTYEDSDRTKLNYYINFHMYLPTRPYYERYLNKVKLLETSETVTDYASKAQTAYKIGSTLYNLYSIYNEYSSNNSSEGDGNNDNGNEDNSNNNNSNNSNSNDDRNKRKEKLE